MALLNAGHKTAMAGEKPLYRHTFGIYVPQAAGSSTFNLNAFHDDDGGPWYVTKKGRRIAEAYNQSFQHPGNLSSGLYRFTVRNDDGKFYPITFGNYWYNSTGAYQADPTECRVYHRLYIWAGGTWSELDMVQYVGQVQDVEFDDSKMIATIEAKALAAVELDYAWDEGDGNETDTGMNVIM